MNNTNNTSKTILDIAQIVNEQNISYQFVEQTALFLQNILTDSLDIIHISVQWDSMESARELFSAYSCSPIQRINNIGFFEFQLNKINIHVQCHYNLVVKTDPYRIQIIKDDQMIWCKSAYAYLFYRNGSDQFVPTIHQFFQNEQKKLSLANKQAWNQNNYQALINRFGEPKEAAKKIMQNPEWRLHPFYPYMGNVSGKKVAHLLGSNGNKGVALALLGADVTIVDFSAENKEYAEQLAHEAGVTLNYFVTDVLALDPSIPLHSFDIVLMELGVLHYFLDLEPLFRIIKSLLAPKGIFLLHEFHPISTKLISSSGKKHKVNGNYFNPTIESTNVAFSKHLPNVEQQSMQKAFLRKWTIGEVLTSIASAKLFIQVVEEEPNHKSDDIGIPKTYTVVATNTN